MNNKRIIIILMIFTIIFTLMGGTFAYFNWQSADNRKTNVTFTVNRNYTCGADSGGHITSSDVRLAPAKCTDSTYAIRRTITTSVTTQSNKVVSMKLWLNINSIDTNLTNTANFKWVIGKNKFGCESGIINQGDFRNIQNGKIDLFDGSLPASSPSTRSTRVARKPFCSKKRRYMRSSMDAQSIASVPPTPAVIRKMALFWSNSPVKRRDFLRFSREVDMAESWAEISSLSSSPPRSIMKLIIIQDFLR